jgi:hypothetical protein
MNDAVSCSDPLEDHFVAYPALFPSLWICASQKGNMKCRLSSMPTDVTGQV